MPTMKFDRIAVAEWGYAHDDLTPEEIIARLVGEVEQAIAATNPDLIAQHEQCGDKEGFARVCIQLPTSAELFRSFFASRGGYRAQYALGKESGEAWNAALLKSLMPTLSNLPAAHMDGVDQAFLASSLDGIYTKFWYTKEVTDPANQHALLGLEEVVRWSPWARWWGTKTEPRSGLVLPEPELHAILLNGSFVKAGETPYDQKPGRSDDIVRRGWT